MFENNARPADRAARAVAGAGLLAASTKLGVTSAKPLGIVTALLGVVLVLTAVTGCCPLYRALGFSTVK
jgi:hypothetical protein